MVIVVYDEYDAKNDPLYVPGTLNVVYVLAVVRSSEFIFAR